MFYGSVPEKGSQIDISDCMPDAFENMLSYMYTDKVKKLTVDNVFPTMRCADKYDLPQLDLICAEYVATQLNAENCMALLELAIQWKVDDIVEKCLQLVELQSDVILKSEQFTAIAQDTLKMVLERSAISAEENAIYLAVERWAVEACKRSDLEPSGTNRRKMLGRALFLVRFPLLNGAQLAEGPAKTGLLLESELLSIFIHQNGGVQPPLPFPTEWRGCAALRIGQLEFKPGEEVFAESPSGRWWQSAKIVGTRQARVVVKWCASGQEDSLAAEKVVRATDILKSGQPMYTDVGQGPRNGTYMTLHRETHHRIRYNERDEGYCTFSELLLHATQVATWKANKANWIPGLG
ncbi:BTB/POZ domain-containing protein 6-like isoform X3 [Paramacrobiotus metropolitanus]|uniref:BTB/POZ domain-containing protein 6-like isoform X3 n=1 Tax=Paramacrobiotus metropolitanus TaxID=2943436 RepID=UPI002445B84C|nr:BTB/POZ domain-containing protein 6-like isoform X3 [Paramacrobiotus metropolitanus]